MKNPEGQPRFYAIVAIMALAWVIVARIVGPSDAWDHTQPRTLSYTTDIVVNDHWVLPEEAGERATKPPLYNWMAAPIVEQVGFSHEVVHKWPSLLALVLCWVTLALWGPRLLGVPAPATGWLAAAIFVSSYAIFKLGYLARPDMLLILFTQLAWLSGITLLIAKRPSRWVALLFWTCIGLGALAKGPAILPVVLWAAVSAKLITGRFSGTFRWIWGAPIALAIFGGWLYMAWRLDADHVYGTMWMEQIVGRVTGTGPHGADGGSIELITSAPDVSLYYLSRFLPWSVFVVTAAMALWPKARVLKKRIWRVLGREGAVMQASLLLVVITVAVFTLSAGKRADYVATAYPASALLAAWFLRRGPFRIGVRWPRIVAGTIGLTLGALTVDSHFDRTTPAPGFGDAVNDFASRVEMVVRKEPMPLVVWHAGTTNLQAFVGYAGPDDSGHLIDSMSREGPLYIVAGRSAASFEQWLARQPFSLDLDEITRSVSMPWTGGNDFELVLYRARRR